MPFKLRKIVSLPSGQSWGPPPSLAGLVLGPRVSEPGWGGGEVGPASPLLLPQCDPEQVS